MEPTKLEVWPNPDGGFYVVERDYGDSLGNKYDMPRGWTYPTREMAEKAIPFVAKGIFYPTEQQLNEGAR